MKTIYLIIIILIVLFIVGGCQIFKDIFKLGKDAYLGIKPLANKSIQGYRQGEDSIDQALIKMCKDIINSFDPNNPVRNSSYETCIALNKSGRLVEK